MEGVALVVSLLNAAGLVVLSARALAARRVADAPVLARFAGAFLLLALAQGASVALDVLTQGASSLSRASFDALDALFWAYYGALVAGFGLLLSTFTRRKLRLVLAVAPVLLVAGPVAQAVVALLAMLVVVHAGLNHIERARAGSFATATGYACLFLAHAAFLLDHHPLSPRSVVGDAVHLAGVLLLVGVALARRR